MSPFDLSVFSRQHPSLSQDCAALKGAISRSLSCAATCHRDLRSINSLRPFSLSTSTRDASAPRKGRRHVDPLSQPKPLLVRSPEQSNSNEKKENGNRTKADVVKTKKKDETRTPGSRSRRKPLLLPLRRRPWPPPPPGSPAPISLLLAANTASSSLASRSSTRASCATATK